jgi:hypothetical protein
MDAIHPVLQFNLTWCLNTTVALNVFIEKRNELNTKELYHVACLVAYGECVSEGVCYNVFFSFKNRKHILEEKGKILPN